MITVVLLVLSMLMSLLAGFLVAPAPPVGLWAWRLMCWSLTSFLLALMLGGVKLPVG